MLEDLKKLETLDCKPPGATEQPTKASSAPMGFNSAVIKPETRLNKTENAGQHLKPPKCRFCGAERKREAKFGNWQFKCKCYSKAKFSELTNEDYEGCKPEQPNQNLMIITEIEGLMSQVNDKLVSIPIGSYIGSGERRKLMGQAAEEIDLFQKTTLFELRKAFE